MNEPPSNLDSLSEDRPGLTRSDQNVLIGLMLFVLACSGLHLYQLKSGGGWIERKRLESRKLEFQIEINEAGWIEWMQLESVGEVMGRRIVEDREIRGPFLSIDDVDRVSGIGPATMAKIRPHLRCRDCNSHEP
ncbi:MAG: helix-hairpin-helix domain-containing protein [Planctomycetaceae bacterium]|nr:helix-hairpin-helix domain-containing protein [Planctomycetaceae bacterium]